MATTVEQILAAAFFTPTRSGWGLPILCWAGPGCAKTDIIQSLALQSGLPFEALAPGERGEGAFGVTPVPDKKLEFMNYPPPEWVKKMNEGGLIFLDELTTAPPAIQPALLGIALAKRIGGYYFGDRVRVVAAANNVEEAAGGWDLAPPLANRFGHINWEHPSAENWSDWMFGEADEEVVQTLDPEIEEERVLKYWTKPWAQARGLVTGFIRRKPGQIHKQPAIGHPDASKAWPSHRTWEMATRALASAQVHNLSDTAAVEFAGAFVGQGAISELMTYQKEADLPDPEHVLDGKVRFKHDKRRLDRTFAVLSACAALVGPEEAENRKERAEVLFALMLDIADKAVDVVWPAAKTMSKARMQGFNADSKKLYKKMMPIANASKRAA